MMPFTAHRSSVLVLTPWRSAFLRHDSRRFRGGVSEGGADRSMSVMSGAACGAALSGSPAGTGTRGIKLPQAPVAAGGAGHRRTRSAFALFDRSLCASAVCVRALWHPKIGIQSAPARRQAVSSVERREFQLIRVIDSGVLFLPPSISNFFPKLAAMLLTPNNGADAVEAGRLRPQDRFKHRI